MGGSRWVGGWEKFQKKEKENRKSGGERGENKVPKKNKIGDQGKKKLRSGLRKGEQKKSAWDGTGMEKRIL
jgi:hypothetical protein